MNKKINNRIIIKESANLAVFIGILLLFIFSCLFVYFMSLDDSLSFRTKSHGWELIGLLIFIIPIYFTSLTNKDINVSDIYIYKDYLELVYKQRNKEVNRKRIEFIDIEKFNVEYEISLIGSGKSRQYVVCGTYNLELRNGETVFFLQNDNNNFWVSPFDAIYKLIDNSRFLPNFNIDVKSKYKPILEEIEYYKKFGKKLPFIEKAKKEIKNVSLIGKIFYGIIITLFASSILFILYLTIPTPMISSDEVICYEKIESAIEYRIDDKDYNKAIQELNEAKKLIPTDPKIYTELAYNYKKLKQYDKAIEAAKTGIQYINNNSVYNKGHNFKFANKEDIALYTVLGECYKKVKDYQNMADCFTYVINNVKYTYTDAYFERGQAFYHLGRYNEAKQDFFTHKSIIEDYIDDQENSEYKSAYPMYSQEDLININKWIDACG